MEELLGKLLASFTMLGFMMLCLRGLSESLEYYSSKAYHYIGLIANSKGFMWVSAIVGVIVFVLCFVWTLVAIWG